MATIKSKDVKDIAVGVSFLLPNILGFLVFTTIPLVISLFMAFTDWNLQMHNMFQQDQAIKFIGVENFRKLFTDPDFLTYLGNTLFLMMGIPFGVAGSLGAALLLNQDFKRGRRRIFWTIAITILMTASCMMLVLAGMGGSAMTLLVCGLAGAIIVGGSFGGQSVYRTLFYFPSFTSGVATYILWKKLYSPEGGPINKALQPVLDQITPVAQKLTPESSTAIFGALLLLMCVFYIIAMFRNIHRWHEGESGTLSLCISAALLSTPMLCAAMWCGVPDFGWGKIAGLPAGAVLTLALTAVMILWALLRVLRGRGYKCVLDYGMSDAFILSGVIMIVLFTLLGLTNVVLALPADAGAVGGLKAPKWISDYYWAKPSLMLMGFWGSIGSNNMLLYLAGLSGISSDLYEAADIDGASPVQRFWNVTWPQLSNVTFFILIMGIMGGLQGGFETARVMTNGGPAGSTTTLAYYIYTEGFATGRLGYASAVAWTLFAMVLCVTIFNWKFGNKYTND